MTFIFSSSYNLRLKSHLTTRESISLLLISVITDLSLKLNLAMSAATSSSLCLMSLTLRNILKRNAKEEKGLVRSCPVPAWTFCRRSSYYNSSKRSSAFRTQHPEADWPSFAQRGCCCCCPQHREGRRWWCRELLGASPAHCSPWKPSQAKFSDCERTQLVQYGTNGTIGNCFCHCWETSNDQIESLIW